MSLLTVRNNVLDIHPPYANKNLTRNGSSWLWAVTAIYGVTFLAWLLWTISLRRQRAATTYQSNGHEPKTTHDATAIAPTPRGERVFHYLFTIAAFVGLVAYFTMASNLGNTGVRQYLNTGATPDIEDTYVFTRQIFWVRYIYWFVAWPLVLIANLLVSGVSWATILFSTALLEIWIVTWLCGALTGTSYRWGYFAFGCFAYFVLAYLLLAWGRGSSRGLGATATKSYTMLAGLLVLVWIVYIVAWGLSEGGNRIGVTGEMIFYGILDLISVPVYGSLFLVMSRKFDHTNSFAFSQWGRRSGREGVVYTAAPAPATV